MEVIIDTDPGVDDAFALAYAHGVGLAVAALTTSYGNASVEATTRNAGFVVGSLGSDWPIYQGAAGPLKGEGRLASCHGTSGLGNVTPDPSQVRAAEAVSAAAFFETVASGDDIYDLFCLGPLTNVAEAFARSPEIVNNIGRIVIMGGAFSERGNVTKDAEFNVFNDPLAWQQVVDRVQGIGVPTTVIPAEVCRKVQLTEADLKTLSKRELLPNLRAIVGPYLEYYTQRASHGTYEGAVMYDVLVPLYYKEPGLFTAMRADIKVTQDGDSSGKTVATRNPNSNLKVCTAIKADQAKEAVMETLSGRR